MFYYSRQQGDGKRAVYYANQAVKQDQKGKIQLLFRGSLHHALGKDKQALKDFQASYNDDTSPF